MSQWKIILAIGVFGLVSCSVGSREHYSDIADVNGPLGEHSADIGGLAGRVTQVDREFVYQATVQCLYDIELAQIAQQRVSSAAVIDFAHGVTDECQALDRQLALVAERHVGVTPPIWLDRSHAAMRDELAALADKDFERAYVLDQVAASKGAVQLFTQQSSNGGEPVLKSFATAALPELQQRVSAAQSLGDQFHD